MSETPALLYLEADDEITAVVRRVRTADAGRVVVVAPGRSRATSSAVALRLLARAATDAGREIAVVGDPLTRSLAAEAGILAFASVDEARRATGDAVPPATAPRAAIHVVRGSATEEGAPTLAAAPAILGSDEVTRPVPVTRHPRRASQARRSPRLLSAVPTAALAAIALLLAGGIVAAAILLPAATITIAARAEPIEDVAYTLPMSDAAREPGSAEATATVTASETYETLEAATGTVTFRNFNTGSVQVPAGTLVAAGEQAFESTEDVVVPPGSLTSDGRIAAGLADAPVRAAAPGPAANVAAEAIDTVLSQGTAAQLRGFPQNGARLVINAEPTAGGVDEAGPEITQADVDRAVAALRDELLADRVAATEADEGELVLEVLDAEPTLTPTDDLPGTRDQGEVEISGSLAWEVLRIDEAAVRRAAADRLVDDGAVVPTEREVLEGSERVEIVGTEAVGDVLTVEVLVDADTVAEVDEEAVTALVAGLDPDDAEAALADIGEANVDLWPGWVSTIPGFEWRIAVRVVTPESPAASAEPEASP